VRIAILHPFTWADVRRGAERYAHDLSWWLAAQGHDVDYVAGGPQRSELSQDGVRIVRLHHRHGDRLTGWGWSKPDTFGATVLPWLARNRYDVVHAMVPSAAIAARLARQRTVFTAIGHPVDAAAEGRARRLLVLAARAAHVATVLSRSAASGFADITGRTPLVVSPGVRTDVFTAELAARTGAPRLLFAAPAAAPRKRLADLLAAMPAVLDALPDARLRLGGGGEIAHDVPRRVAEAVDSIGTGELEDVPKRYRDATTTVLPSEHEAFGLVLVESLASGTPVVAAASGGIAEIVDPGAGVGALTPVGDIGALAAAIVETVRLAADPETPARCAAHAQRWSWDSVGPAHLAAYEAALR
jgi:phosphatidylinositol alpha-mannosyltransferase